MKRDVLCRPFAPEQIKQREGHGGKTFSYVEAHSVIARLNEACDAWSFDIVEHQILDEEVVVVAKLTADGIVKMAFGGAEIARDRTGRPLSIADSLKAAGSDALKKAASLLGVALNLYGGSEERPTQAGTASSASTSTNDRLTGRQHSAIQAVVRRREIDGDRLTTMLEERFRKSDLLHLSRREASSFISELAEANGVHR